MSSSSSSASSSSSSTAMDSSFFPSFIYWEQQESALCGVHALNNLLQGPYYTAIDLSTIASQLKETERALMSASGESSREYLSYMAADSSFVDESGNFSVEVLKKALEAWGLQLTPIGPKSSEGKSAFDNPTAEEGFIANYHQHWLALRKIGGRWFNLNSLLDGPELISDFYLSAFLGQLITEGYVVFVVKHSASTNSSSSPVSRWPPTDTHGGDNYRRMEEVLKNQNRDKGSAQKKKRNDQSSAMKDTTADDELAMVLEISRRESEGKNNKSNSNDNNKRARTGNNGGVEDDELQQALKLSMQLSPSTNSSITATGTSTSISNHTSSPNASSPIEVLDDNDDDDDLKRAIALSLQHGTLPQR